MGNVKPVTKGFLIGGLVLVAIVAYMISSISGQKPGHIVRINSKNPALEAAIKEARSGLDAFIKELAAPKPGEGFAVRGTFQTIEGPEYLWVRSPVFADDKFTGKLDQQPIAVKGKNKGDEVTVAKKDVVDWLIKDDTGVRGAVTEKVLSGAGPN